MRLNPDEVRAELAERFAGATSDAVLAFARGKRTVRLSEGSTVRRLTRPGWLEVNGARMYSAAWL